MGHPDDVQTTFPSESLMETVAFPVPLLFNTRTSKRAWSAATRRYTTPGDTVFTPFPVTSTSYLPWIDVSGDDARFPGKRFAKVIATAWARCPSTSSQRVLNCTVRIESSGPVGAADGTTDGVIDIAKIWSLFVALAVCGSVILSNGAREETDTEIWKIWDEFQLVEAP